MRSTRASLFALTLALSSSTFATISYTVKFDPVSSQLKVRMEFPTNRYLTTVCMPAWSPGSYVLRDGYKSVLDFSATTQDGKPIETVQSNERWRLSTEKGTNVVVTYSLPQVLADGAISFSGPTTYMYVEGRTQEECRLNLDFPADFRVAIGLVPQGNDWNYSTKTYDVLADNPVSAGDLLIDEYNVAGKTMTIAMRNASKAFVDRKVLIAQCKKITETQAKFFGGFAPEKYVWHFAVGERADGGGGLEHLSSTSITLASGMQKGIEGVLSHEFFHLWNVKRIRSAVLGPFDYSQLPKTGALWWLEGVTDYYGHMLLARSGQQDWSDYFTSLINNNTTNVGNPAYKEVSPYEASFRVSEAANGRGNSQGYKLSYYNLGFVAGFCLDIELRFRTNGKYSLDSVTRELWRQCRDDQPGFAEHGLRDICVKFGGIGMGEYYDQIIMKPGNINMDEQLAKIGYKAGSEDRVTAGFGFDYQPSAKDKGLRVSRVVKGFEGQFALGDFITKINGKSLELPTTYAIILEARQLEKETKGGSDVKLSVRKADGKTSEVTIKAETRTAKRSVVTELGNASATAKRLRENWMKGK
ncbi:MAG: hypothetical protein K8R88_14640 [Armatimonadetes bacterium]|nr:hypothetical protein [Armatimonadota bacterium]